LNLKDETIVVFTSDNGGLSTLGRRSKAPTSNAPLRAGKGWCYEGGIRVPLIISAPGVTRPGTTCDVPVISTDFYPTILELTGLPPMRDQHVDGVSLRPLLEGAGSLDRDSIYWHFPHYHGSTWAPGAAIRAGAWKLIEFYEEETIELYNLDHDLSETRDLSRVHPRKAKELRDRLRNLQQGMGARLPQPNPKSSAP
jgi:arylsulfatase A-like enzyme